ncbi:hypothetical protein Tco_1269838 [Tanacetum coccineum]
MQVARDRQKSYAILKRKPMDFQVGDKVMLKISPWKWVIRFGKRGKLNPRYVGPFKVLEKVGSVAYKLELPEELSRVHNTFHVAFRHLRDAFSVVFGLSLTQVYELGNSIHFISIVAIFSCFASVSINHGEILAMSWVRDTKDIRIASNPFLKPYPHTILYHITDFDLAVDIKIIVVNLDSGSDNNNSDLYSTSQISTSEEIDYDSLEPPKSLLKWYHFLSDEYKDNGKFWGSKSGCNESDVKPSWKYIEKAKSCMLAKAQASEASSKAKVEACRSKVKVEAYGSKAKL